MPSDRSSYRTCDLWIELSQIGGATTRYGPKDRFSRQIAFGGRVNDPPTGGGWPDLSTPHFNGKAVFLTVEWPHSDWLDKVRVQHNVGDACGYAYIYAGVDPERYELEGKTREVQPIQVSLVVNAEAFDAIFHQASGNPGEMLSAKIVLAGNKLPELAEDRGTIWLSDLDVSKGQQYAVSEFEIRSTLGAGLSKQA